MRRIRLVRQLFRRIGERTWVPVPASVQLHDVDRVPDVFAEDPAIDDQRTLEVGVLVDLDASDPAG